MARFVVIHSDTLQARHGKVVKDALGRPSTGWIVFEDGMPGYPHKTREAAESFARSVAAIRACKPDVTVIE
jgi:hypothetical protein